MSRAARGCPARPRGERSARWRECRKGRMCDRKTEGKGCRGWKSTVRLGRAGRRASGAGGCPSFKFSTPRLVPLSGVPGPSLRPALPPQSAKSARAFAVAGERGWERWAVVPGWCQGGRGICGTFFPPSRPRECVRLLVRCARGHFNKGYDCPLGSGG